MYVVVIGKDTTPEKKPKLTVLSVNFGGLISRVEEHNFAEFLLDDVDRLNVDQPRASADGKARLLIKKGNDLSVMQVIGTKSSSVSVELERVISLKDGEQIVTVTNGLIVAENS